MAVRIARARSSSMLDKFDGASAVPALGPT